MGRLESGNPFAATYWVINSESWEMLCVVRVRMRVRVKEEARRIKDTIYACLFCIQPASSCHEKDIRIPIKAMDPGSVASWPAIR